jgi:hypothetical protein
VATGRDAGFSALTATLAPYHAQDRRYPAASAGTGHAPPLSLWPTQVSRGVGRRRPHPGVLGHSGSAAGTSR